MKELPQAIAGAGVALAGDLAHQLSRVLRLKVGDRVVLVNGRRVPAKPVVRDELWRILERYAG